MWPIRLIDRQAISQAIDQGDIVYVATGRKYSAAKEVAQLVHPEIKVVASNGCVYETEDELFIDPLKSESLEAIYQTVNEAQLSLFFFGLEKTFFTDELPAYFVAEDPYMRFQ